MNTTFNLYYKEYPFLSNSILSENQEIEEISNYDIASNKLSFTLNSSNTNIQKEQISNIQIFNPFHMKYERVTENKEENSNLYNYLKNNRLIRFQSIKILDGRGRKPKFLNQKRHTSTDFDNLQLKIQVHFINFIINITNDALIAEYGNKNKLNVFKDIPYEIKKKINFEICGNFKRSTIKDILKNKISSRYSRFSKNTNTELLKNLSISSIWLNEFFNMKYLNIFIYYYNKEKPLEEFWFKGKKIVLSQKTKTFYHLLIKNENIKEKLIDTAKIVYFNEYSTLIGKSSFLFTSN